MNETVANCELWVVIPCLKDADTIAKCVGKALRSMEEAGIAGEIIISDNGSTDGSIEIAKKMGAHATMIDRARASYKRWLGQPGQILQSLRTHFDPERQSIAWGKLTFVGRPRQYACDEREGER
jgi:hypothetical protein